MPRNVSGVYSLPAGNPVVSGTDITVDWANPTMSDIAAELTASLPRSDVAPMTGPLILAADAVQPKEVAADAVQPKEATTLQQLNAAVSSSTNYLPAGALMDFGWTSRRPVSPRDGWPATVRRSVGQPTRSSSVSSARSTDPATARRRSTCPTSAGSSSGPGTTVPVSILAAHSGRSSWRPTRRTRTG